MDAIKFLEQLAQLLCLCYGYDPKTAGRVAREKTMAYLFNPDHDFTTITPRELVHLIYTNQL